MEVRFSGHLLRFTSYERTVTMDASTVGDALTSLRERFPQLGPVLWDGNGNLQRVHRLILNGEIISCDTGRSLRDTDQLEFVTAVAGGVRCPARSATSNPSSPPCSALFS
jgi:molybdopterin synthase sulfur carrier subunit